MLYFVCKEKNDLFLALEGSDFKRVDTLEAALVIAQKNDGILVLAEEYPSPGIQIKQEYLTHAQAKGIRLYIEYPASLPEIEIGAATCATLERVVVASDFFSPSLTEDTILSMHRAWFLPVEGENVHLYLARVAGYNQAIFGLPSEKYPLLFELTEGVLLATSKLSGFIMGRYAPNKRWAQLWEQLLTWLSSEEIKLNIKPRVYLRAKPDEILPSTIEEEVFDSSCDWFWRNAVYSRDKIKGAIEGYESAICWDGYQQMRITFRADCMSETALVFAYRWAVKKDPSSRELARQILERIWKHEGFFNGNPDSPRYGLLKSWEDNESCYGDGNAKAIMCSYAVSSLIGDHSWLERITRCLLANLRITGALGFRRSSISLNELEQKGWQFYQQEEITTPAPHYQAYLWAANLWAYNLTGDEVFFNKTESAIAKTMELYPAWRWTNGFTQELARILLPLAYLIKAKDTPLYRGWLNTVADALLAQMQPSGGIRELLGAQEYGKYPSPQRNKDYGTNEASLIQQNGDPACDLLYTNNFAFLGLHEAAKITKEERLIKAEDRLADFLCRIQALSDTLPTLNGAWLRSFDDELWEYWGSSADLSWGAWCVETGWSNSWIASVLAMRILDQTFFNDSFALNLKDILPKLKEEMLV